ncbi:MAG: hypothetical protein ACRD2U_05000 [Terriglobales bacterium]
MFKTIKEFVVDAGGWGTASVLAAAVSFGISIWDHFHDKPVSSLVFVCLTVPLFWTGSYIAWIKKKQELENEKSLHDGPEISFSWPTIRPANTKRTLFLENTGPIDAYEVKISDFGLNRAHCAAQFPVISKCSKNSREALNFELIGDSVPPNRRDEIDMVVYASGSDFSKDDKGRDVVDFPITATFEEYGGAKYEANFRFLADPYLEKVNIHRVSRKRIN